MSRTPKPSAAASAPELPSASISLATVPAVTALLGLLDAMRALVSFPSHPVPNTLVDNVLAARKQFSDALDTAFEPVAIPGAAPYDDAWIGERFERFASLVDERFGVLEKANDSRDEAAKQVSAVIDERFAGLDEALRARFGALDEASKASAGALEGIQARLDALEAAATAPAED